jgi:hypothetical protein
MDPLLGLRDGALHVADVSRGRFDMGHGLGETRPGAGNLASTACVFHGCASFQQKKRASRSGRFRRLFGCAPRVSPAGEGGWGGIEQQKRGGRAEEMFVAE